MSFLKIHKGKILLALLSFFVFAVLIFPYSETSDLISSTIADGTQNQVLFRFQSLSLGLIPKPGLNFSQAHLKVVGVNAIDADELVVTPSLSSLFSQIPYGSVTARGAFGRASQIEVQMHTGTKSETGTDRQRIDIHATQLSLEDLKELADLPLLIKGSSNLELKAQFDLLLSEAPEADFQLDTERFEFPSQTVNTQMGPLNFPTLKLSGATFKGKLNAGRLVIEEGRLGTEKDELHGTLTGSVGLVLQKQGGFSARPSNYNFDIDLSLKPSLEEKLSLFLSPLESYKTVDHGQSRYQIRLSGQNFNAPPAMSALH